MCSLYWNITADLLRKKEAFAISALRALRPSAPLRAVHRRVGTCASAGRTQFISHVKVLFHVGSTQHA